MKKYLSILRYFTIAFIFVSATILKAQQGVLFLDFEKCTFLDQRRIMVNGVGILS